MTKKKPALTIELLLFFLPLTGPVFHLNREVPSSKPSGCTELVRIRGDVQPGAHAQPGPGPVGPIAHGQFGEFPWCSLVGGLCTGLPPPWGLFCVCCT